MQVTARELKLRLGRYLEAVRSGETVRITLRGMLIAEIRPLGLPASARLAELAAAGRLTPGVGGPLPPHVPVPGRVTGSDVILADRAAEAGP